MHQSLFFVACILTSKTPGIGFAERSWGVIKKIKPGKRSTTGSNIYKNQSIVYTNNCHEVSIIGNIYIYLQQHEDYAFDYQ